MRTLSTLIQEVVEELQRRRAQLPDRATVRQEVIDAIRTLEAAVVEEVLAGRFLRTLPLIGTNGYRIHGARIRGNPGSRLPVFPQYLDDARDLLCTDVTDRPALTGDMATANALLPAGWSATPATDQMIEDLQAAGVLSSRTMVTIAGKSVRPLVLVEESTETVHGLVSLDRLARATNALGADGDDACRAIVVQKSGSLGWIEVTATGRGAGRRYSHTFSPVEDKDLDIEDLAGYLRALDYAFDKEEQKGARTIRHRDLAQQVKVWLGSYRTKEGTSITRSG